MGNFMSNPDNSRVSFTVAQQPDGLYDINVQISGCTPARGYEILKRVEIAVSNLPIMEVTNSNTPEESTATNS